MTNPFVALATTLPIAANPHESSLGAFFRGVPENQRRILARAAVAALRIGTDGGDLFGMVVRKTLQISGFRNPMAAQDVVLVNHVTRALGDGWEPICVGVLQVWKQQHLHICRAISTWCRQQGIDASHVTSEHCDTILELAGAAREREGVTSGPAESLDVALGVLCVRQDGFADRDQEMDDQVSEEETVSVVKPVPDWEHILLMVEDVAPDSSIWHTVDEFVSRVQEIAAAKVAARLSGQQAVMEALSSLVSSHEEEIAYLQLDTAGWRPQAVPQSRLMDVLDAIKRFGQKLDEFGKVRAGSAKTFAEERARGETLAALRADVVALFEQLAQNLPPSQSVSAGPADEPRAVDPDHQQQPAKGSPAEVALELADTESPKPLEGLDPSYEGEHRFEQTDELAWHAADATPAVDSGIGYDPEGAEECDATTSAAASSPGATTAHGGQEVEAPLPAIISQQRAWVAERRLLAATLAAEKLEQSRSVADSAASGYIPSWLCKFALTMSDSGTAGWTFEPGTLIPHHMNLAHENTERQRLFFGWLCVGLLGPAVQRALTVAATVDIRTMSGAWLEESSLHTFCLESLLKPARHGHPPRFDLGQSPADLQARRADHLLAAESITTRASNYKNRFVVRYWMDVVGPSGPLMPLLERARQGTLVEALPSSEMLAMSVRGWDQVLAAYRNNVLNRLADFTEHLRQVVALDERLRLQQAQSSALISNSDVAAALDDARHCAARLAEQSCPSTGAIASLAESLHALSQGKRHE